MLSIRSGQTQRTPTVHESRLASPPVSSPNAALQPNPAGAHFDRVKPRVITLALDNQRTDAEILVSGNTVWVPNSTNATDTLSVRFDSLDSDALPMQKGNSLQGVPFNKLLVSNAATAGATLTLVVFNVNPDHPLTLR